MVTPEVESGCEQVTESIPARHPSSASFPSSRAGVPRGHGSYTVDEGVEVDDAMRRKGRKSPTKATESTVPSRNTFA